MAELPRHPAEDLMGRPLLAFLCLLIVAAPLTRAGAVDLVGTWHVLVHYKDSSTAHPERERWEDRVWVFGREESLLRWTDYPIVVFADQTGRFEELGTNRASRVLHFWEPNAAQLAQIHQGLEINPLGSRSKTLRGSDDEGWSSGKKGGYQSARFITYQETWRITGVPDRPSFVRDDVLGSVATESVTGRTVWEGETVESGGDVVRGRFERDGTRVGTFRMMRCGAVSTVKGSGKSQAERIYDLFFGEMASQLYGGELPGGGSEQELRQAIEDRTFSDDDRRALRVRFEEKIAEFYQNQGNDPREFRPQIQSLARKMVALFVDEGKSIEEIQRMLTDGRLRP
jgi:hypothetical protein